LTLTSGARARARERVLVLRAAFDATYAIELPGPVIAEIDETLTTAPLGDGFRYHAPAVLVQRDVGLA